MSVPDGDYPDHKTRPRETWSAAQCARAARHRRKDSWGSRGPPGLFQGSADAYPRYGTRRFNGGHWDGENWYRVGTRYPYPKVPEPYALYRLCSWGAVIATRADAETRGLAPHELKLDADGFAN